MKSLQNLREQRAAKAVEVRNKLDSTVTNWDDKAKADVDQVYADISRLDEQIERFEKSLTIQDSLETRASILADQNGRSVDENANELAKARNAFTAWCQYGMDNLRSDEREALKPVSNGSVRPGVRNAAESATAGVLVPTVIMPTAIAKLKAFGGMREASSQIATASGNPLSWGTYDDTSSEGEIVGETTAAADDDLDSFSSVTIGAYKFSSKVVPVSIEIIQDSAVNIEQVVMDSLLMRVARGQNHYFTTGTGTSQPKGVVASAAAGKTGASGQVSSVLYTDLVDLVHSLDPAYRMKDSVRFMFNDSTLKAIKKLVDGNGRPLWLPSTAGALGSKDPDTIMGYKYTINQHMAALGASAKPILFGDFSKYLIRDVMEMQIFRFTDSAYVKKGQVGFLVWARADGKMIDASNESIRYFANPAS